MSSRPLITIKAGRCEVTDETVIPIDTPGYLYAYISSDDDLLHLAWKARDSTTADEDNEFIVFPGDATLVPYERENRPQNGRIFVLKFSSSGERKLFWLQSKSEKEDDEGWFSPRDLSWARRFNSLLAGEESDDAVMADADSTNTNTPAAPSRTPAPAATQQQSSSSGGAPDIMSLLQSIHVPTSAQQQGGLPRTAILSLTDLLSPKNTLPILYQPSLSTLLPTLKENLPPGIIPADASERETIRILEKVLRSPQFSQACASLTGALREGALPVVAESLRLDISGVEGAGVGGLVEGLKRQVEKEKDDGDVEMAE